MNVNYLLCSPQSNEVKVYYVTAEYHAHNSSNLRNFPSAAYKSIETFTKELNCRCSFSCLQEKKRSIKMSWWQRFTVTVNRWICRFHPCLEFWSKNYRLISTQTNCRTDLKPYWSCDWQFVQPVGHLSGCQHWTCVIHSELKPSLSLDFFQSIFISN